jgi:hypothetical protein
VQVAAEPSHEVARQIPVVGGAHRVLVRPWTVRQREELRPLIAALMDRVQVIWASNRTPLAPTPDGSGVAIDLAKLFLEVEAEVFAIVRASTQLPDGLEWDSIWWEDVPTLAQAIWETSIVRASGGGLAGKLADSLVAALEAVLRRAGEQQKAAAVGSIPRPNGSGPSVTPPISSPGPSASSPGGGDPIPTA